MDLNQPGKANRLSCPKFPQTRYQGSKLKLISSLHATFDQLSFSSALDAFGGTGSVSYLFKKLKKEVYFNDILKFNFIGGIALIQNQDAILEENDILTLLHQDTNCTYASVIADNFQDIYYLEDENIWLDIIIQNIHRLNNEYKKALAFWALFQACLIKRPYNLFHRKNLNVRTSEVKRSFGNKATWDKSFKEHFVKFCAEANRAVFASNQHCESMNMDVLEIKTKCDLVYLDPPYIPQKGSLTNYHEFYHFLEGITNYHEWSSHIDYNSKHRRLNPIFNPWQDKKTIEKEFEKIIEKFKESQIVISYRNDGIPSIEAIVKILQSQNKKVSVKYENYQYALSKKYISEAIIVGE